MDYRAGRAVLLKAPPTLASPTVAVLLCAFAHIVPIAWNMCPSLKSCLSIKAILRCHISHEPFLALHYRCCLPPSAP